MSPMRRETRGGTWLFPRGRKQRTQARSVQRAAQTVLDRERIAEQADDIQPGDRRHAHLWFHVRDFTSEYSRADGHWACMVPGCGHEMKPRERLPVGARMWPSGDVVEPDIGPTTAPTPAELEALDPFERRMLWACLRIISAGGSYCHAHGYQEWHCTEGCFGRDFPDLSPYLGRARAMLAGAQKR